MVERVVHWDSLFYSRIFWAQVGYTLSEYYEDNLIFGASFSSSAKVQEVRKLNQTHFDDWDDGHTLLFPLPENYQLWYQISDHTMGTWTLENSVNSTQIVICRLDGHPLLPGFTYSQAETLINYLCPKLIANDISRMIKRIILLTTLLIHYLNGFANNEQIVSFDNIGKNILLRKNQSSANVDSILSSNGKAYMQEVFRQYLEY